MSGGESLLTQAHRRIVESATRRVVTWGNGQSVSTGTGFFVAPGCLVTAAHVVPPGDSYTYRVYKRQDHEGLAADVVIRKPEVGADRAFGYPDVAALEVPPGEEVCLPLGADCNDVGRTISGYGLIFRDDGSVWDWMTGPCKGERTTDQTGYRFTKFAEDQVQPGQSGTAFVDLKTGRIVGIMSQTRDKTQSLGGDIVPVSTVLSVIRECWPDIIEQNRTASEDSPAARVDRLKVAIHQLSLAIEQLSPRERAILTDAQSEVDDAVLAILEIDFAELRRILQNLASASPFGCEPALRILSYAAAFATIDGRPFVDAEAARMFGGEWDRLPRRVVHLPIARDPSRRLHFWRGWAERASLPTYAGNVTDAVPDTLAPSPSDASLDPTTGLPSHLTTAIRAELLGFDADEDPGVIEEDWQTTTPSDRASLRRLVVQLPPEYADAALLARLRDEFPSCLFAISTPQLPRGLRTSRDVVVIEPSPSPEHIAAADRQYAQLERLLRKANR